MSASFKVDVVPAVLTWARRSAHLSKDDVAQKLAPKPDKRPLWLERVRMWEEGEDTPTLAQLRHLAEIYRRPLPALLLAAPPAEPAEARDFRRPTEVGELPAPLGLALREARERSEIATELVALSNDGARTWTLAADMEETPELLAARIRDNLGVSLVAQADSGLTAWREAIEDAGVLVFGFSGVESSAASGFALTGGEIPAIGLNNRDAPVRRVFTLLHELTHVVLRTEDALCDLSEDGPSGADVERYCNHVAGAVLVPKDALLSHPLVTRNTSLEWTASSIGALAKIFGVSREVVLRRLLIFQRTTVEHYASWRAALRSEQRDYEKEIEARDGGPSHARKKLAQLGRRYLRLVLDAANRERISLSDASDYLGVKVDHFPKLAAELRGEAA